MAGCSRPACARLHSCLRSHDAHLPLLPPPSPQLPGQRWWYAGLTPASSYSMPYQLPAVRLAESRAGAWLWLEGWEGWLGARTAGKQ